MDLLTIKLEEKSKKPLYIQLYEYIKEEILKGRISPGMRMPSKRNLSVHMLISQNTVRVAYEQLISEGYLESEERKGYYVSEINDLLVLNKNNKEEIQKKDIFKDDILYDFSFQGVDRENFPFKIWRRNFKEVLNDFDEGFLDNPDPQGNLPLRESIADYLKESRGVNCHSSQIVISSGTEYLFQILIQILGEKSVYGLENPGYEKLHLLFKNNKIPYSSISLDKKGMDIIKIKESNANILCITPSHQFPTGNIMPVTRRIEIINWSLEAENRYIIEDDYDSEFKYQGRTIPALQGLEESEKVIYMGAFSKSLFPALRISYMVLPKKLLKIYKEKLSFIISPVPLTEQVVLEKFISNGFFERHLNKMRNLYKKKREVLTKEILKDSKNFLEISGADAGLHLVLIVKNGMREEELIRRALNKKIKVYGISNYYVDGHKNDNVIHPRILLGYAGLNREKIVEGIQLLKEAWRI